MLKIYYCALFMVFSLSNVFSQSFNPIFFVFEDGLWNAQSIDAGYWADLVSESGFDGMELNGLDRVDELIPELEKRDLKPITVYVKIDLDAEQPYDERLKTFIHQWDGKIPYLWLHIHSKKYKPSDPVGDERCVEIISELADFAWPTGLKLAFYPHTGFWVEKVTDGVRLAEKIDRDNVGTVFNLCHFLKADDPAKLEQRIDQSLPYLFLVSINGADSGDTNSMGWDRLIRPLGEGDYNVLNVLRMLRDKGYDNPIGLQCYNIAGEPEEFLKFSVETWRKYIGKLNKN